MSQEEGVVTGCSKSHEWMLPWWYANYCIHNAYPITFFDFGDMTPKALEWCQKRGDVIALDPEDRFVAGKEAIEPALASHWEAFRGTVWLLRPFWFKKPLALLKTPYDKTLWLDADCQTSGSLEPIFKEYLEIADAAVALDPVDDQERKIKSQALLPGEVIYNTGVVAFRKDSPLIQEWAARSRDQNQFHIGDQQVLSRIIFQQQYPIALLPPIYNWPVYGKVNPQAVILHYWGSNQFMIATQIEFLKKNWIMDLSFHS